MNDDSDKKNGDTLAAVCGLYCGACTLYIGSTGDPERLTRLSVLFRSTPEELRCLGCHSAKLGCHCQNCRFKTCAKANGCSTKHVRHHEPTLYEALILAQVA